MVVSKAPQWQSCVVSACPVSTRISTCATGQFTYTLVHALHPLQICSRGLENLEEGKGKNIPLCKQKSLLWQSIDIVVLWIQIQQLWKWFYFILLFYEKRVERKGEPRHATTLNLLSSIFLGVGDYLNDTGPQKIAANLPERRESGPSCH